MSSILLQILFVIAIAIAIFVGIDVAFRREQSLSETVSYVISFLAAVGFLSMICMVVGDEVQGVSMGESFKDILSTAMPFYAVLEDAGKGMTLAGYLQSDPVRFANEFLQTIFMATVIPLVNQALPSNTTATGFLPNLFFRLTVSVMLVGVAVLLYSFFQQTTIAATILDLLILGCTASPFVLIVRCLFQHDLYHNLVVVLVIRIMGRAIVSTAVYLCIMETIATHYADFAAAFGSFMVLLPVVGVAAVTILGIGIMIRSVTH